MNYCVHLCFADPLPGGHRGQHVVAIAREMAGRSGIEIVFAVHPDVVEYARANLDGKSNSYQNCIFRPLTENIFHKVRPNNRDIFNGFCAILKLEQIAEANHCHHIHFMQLDTFLPGLALRVLFPWGKVTYSGLYFRPTMHYSTMFESQLNKKEFHLNRFKSILLSRVLKSRRVTLIQSLDEYFPLYFDNTKYEHKLAGIPDLASPPETAEPPADLPEQWLERPLRLLLFGRLSSRKGVFVLLKDLEQLPQELAQQTSVLFAGQINAAERENLILTIKELRRAQPDVAVDVIDRFLDDAELWWLVQQTILVLAPYQRHLGSSGILCWAAAAGKPVLCQSFGLMGHEVRQNHLGVTVDTENVNALVEAIKNFVSGSFQETDLISKRAAYAARHTQHAFAEATLDTLLSSFE